jgi:hypothetical protein
MAGRPKGSRNKATEFIKPIAQRFGPDCMHAMIKIVKHPKASNLDKVRASELIMAYGYGKPVESRELSGPDGGPIPFSVEGAKAALADVLDEVRGKSA